MNYSTSREANGFSASEEIFRVFFLGGGELNFHFCFYRRSPLANPQPLQSSPAPILSFKKYFNIIVPSTSISSMCFLSLTFPNQTPVWASVPLRSGMATLLKRHIES